MTEHGKSGGKLDMKKPANRTTYAETDQDQATSNHTDEPVLPIPAGAGDSEQGGVQVRNEAAEAFISEKRIGERIKYLRLKKGMGLVELGRHTGLSASFLSQLETGRVVPTLRNLARIAMVFSKDLSYFFDPEPQATFRIHRSKDRIRKPQTGSEDPDYFFESLANLVPERGLNPYFAEFLPAKAGREARAHQHAGSEFLYVLSGQMDLRHGEITHHLDAGDAVYFDASTTHTYLCSGDQPANAVIVTLQSPGLQHGNGNSGPMRGLRPRSTTGNGYHAPDSDTTKHMAS